VTSAGERPVVVTFRRGSFYGDFRNVEPKWHLLGAVDPGKWGTYTAWCGYTRSNIVGDLSVSRSKTPKTAATTCQKCVKALGKHEAQLAKEKNK